MASQAARTLRPEDQISHFRVVGPLGAGGMGEVYLAQDKDLERNVALKILPPDLVKSEERVRRFVLEAKSASSLSHPNIVTIYEIGQGAVHSPGEPDSSPMHFISMELVSGKTLTTLIHEDKTDLRTLLGYLAQAAEGLAKAHAAGIVHRDLKPGNIMVSADGFAKVLDFGLAKLTERREAGAEISSVNTMNEEPTREGAIVGTAGYMSPEQVQGKAVDHRSDIFSFGCVLYEATARRRPFVADSSIETMHKILNEKPTPVEELNSKAPAELRRLIKRCLAKSPEQRLQSMKDLALELREIVDEYETLSASASSGSASSGTQSPLAKRPSAAPLLAAGAVLVLAGLGLAFWVSRRAPAPKNQPFQNMRITTQTSRGDVTDCALSPDARYLAYLANPAGRPASLRVRQVATGSDVEVLPAGDAQIQSPAFSPDGNYLYYSAVKPDNPSYRALYQIPSLGGTPRERVFDVDSRVSFAPDGKQLAFWRGVTNAAEGKLVLLDVDTGTERVLATVSGQEGFRGAPAWSPDGKRIAAVTLQPAPDLQSTIVFFDAATGQRQDFAKLPRTQLSSIAWLRDGSGLVSTGMDLKNSITNQVLLHLLADDGRAARVTNDFNQYAAASTAQTEDVIAAARNTRVANFWLADASGAPARRLTSITTPENSPGGPVPASASTFVYQAPDDRTLNLWSIDVAKGETRRLTSGDALSVNPRANHGIVLVDRFDATGMHVWRMDADGSAARTLTSGAGEQSIDFSSDGQYFLHVRWDKPRTYYVASVQDGKVLLTVSDASGTLGFTPDGKNVVVGKSEKDATGLTAIAWRVLPITGGEAVATGRLPGRIGAPRVAPDSRALTFLNLADPAWNVYRQPFDGGALVPITRFKDGRITNYRWSPDGKKLALRVQAGESQNLWVTDADGSHPLQVTKFDSEIFAFEWLLDSRRVVAAAGTSSWDAVLIKNFR